MRKESTIIYSCGLSVLHYSVAELRPFFQFVFFHAHTCKCTIFFHNCLVITLFKIKMEPELITYEVFPAWESINGKPFLSFQPVTGF